jgi:uncharacterized protein (DUF697 family)
MGVRRSVVKQSAMRVAPSVASGFVRTMLDKAIDGVGPLRPAATTAEAKLVDAAGDVEDAVKSSVRLHVGLAAAEGFITNLGGVAALAVAIPANVVGVTLVQSRLVAGIAHLRGYDLEDARVRNAILACILGEDEVRDLVRTSSFPSSPMGIATSPVHDPALDDLISREVTTDLLARTAGRRAVTMVGRRVPLLGGVVGGGSDALTTWHIGQYAARELRDRNLR